MNKEFLMSKTVKELRGMSKGTGIKNWWLLRKIDLVEKLKVRLEPKVIPQEQVNALRNNIQEVINQSAKKFDIKKFITKGKKVLLSYDSRLVEADVQNVDFKREEAMLSINVNCIVNNNNNNSNNTIASAMKKYTNIQMIANFEDIVFVKTRDEWPKQFHRRIIK
jgi:hypothetical protein